VIVIVLGALALIMLIFVIFGVFPGGRNDG
jgi:hypothetical protein